MPKKKISSYQVSDGKGGTRTVINVIYVRMGSKRESGTSGGTGGNGGNLILTYSTDNFPFNLNHNPSRKQHGSTHLIEILYKAGKDGKFGRNGDSYVGTEAIITSMKRGMPVPANHPPQQDGKITLINADKPL
ncbi:hypothetical protein [Pontibacter chitinilyticus]|uniref:hypothetical protein n=1 Tax=Pontibacter chitinilyticus TaxID=2674989 RepID=UPI003219E4BB